MPQLNASFAPPGESPATLWLERSAFDGTFITCVAYGMLLLLFVQCSHVLLQKNNYREQRRWALFAYTCAIFVLATTALGFSLKFNEMAFVDDRNYPGGPSAFYVAFYSYWVTMASSSCFIVLNWFADGLLLYRFYIIFNLNYWALILPGMMYLGAIVTSIFFLILTARGSAGFWSEQAVHMGTAYWSLTVSLNVVITILICIRLLLTRNEMRAVFGNDHGHLYTKVTTMFVESAALYSAWGLVTLIAYAREDNGVRNIVIGALGQVQGITSLLIVVRVGQGRAYAIASTQATAETLQFGPQSLEYETRDGGTSIMMDLQSTSHSRKQLPEGSILHESRLSLEFKSPV